MKKFYLLMLTCILGIGLAQAQQNYSVTHNDYTSLQMTLTAPVPTVATTSYLDVEYNVLQMPGFAETHTVGEPSLPQFGHMIEIPLCDGFTVKTTSARYDTIDGNALGLTAKLMPTQRPRSKSDNSPLTLSINSTTYATDALYSENLVTVERIGIARNQNLAVLHFSPVQYNPVTNQIVVCRSVDVTITYVNPDQVATQDMQELHYSPAFAAAATMNTLPRKEAAYQGAPIRMLVVAGSTFNGDADLTSYINWKKRKGYLIDVVYTSDANVGTTTTTIAAYIKSQYTNASAENPAPTFVLLIGDAASSVSSNATPTGALVPAFSTQISGGIMQGNSNEHPTDLYYFTWTDGDFVPDCYYGRFSARTTTDLKNIIEKSLTYEQYSFSDPSFINTAVMTAGYDSYWGPKNGDPTHNYCIANYINGSTPYPYDNVYFYINNANNSVTTSMNAANVTVTSHNNGSSSTAATIRNTYSAGSGWINYTAHGDTNMWYQPEFTSTQVGSMTNNGKYGIMIGNCCLTNTFTRPSCFGETLLRKAKAGAVAYIGGSDYTYWDADVWWAVGYRANISATMATTYNSSYVGAYDLMCHTHGEAQNTWHTSLGAMVCAGNNAVTVGCSTESGATDYRQYYWEIYHIMGDPSITPWLTTPDDMTLSVASTINAGTTSLEVTAVPYAYVAMTTGSSEYNFVAAAFANASGVATLTLPSDLAVGTYEVTASAQQYKTAFTNVNVIVPSGPYVTANSLTEDNALNVGQNATYTLALENVGTETANNITISFTSNNDLVSVVIGTYNLASLNASATQTLSGVFSVQADASCTDQMPVTLTATISWTGCETPAVVRLNTVVNAPMPVVTYTWTPTQVAPGGSAVCAVTMTNNGHMAMEDVTMNLTEDFPLVEVTGGPNTFDLAVGGTVNYNYTATVDAQMPNNVTIPFTLTVANDSYNYSEELRLLVTSGGSVEDFNDNDVSDWTSTNNYPWYADNSKYNSASYSMRSYNNLQRNRTSEMSYTWTSTVDDSIRFYYLTSANTSSYLRLYIDGTQTAQIAGTGSTQTSWTRVAYPVTAGEHTYKFAFYRANSWGGSVTNAAWVDDIEFPSNATALVAARTDQVCQNAAYTLNGQNVNTTTEGTQYLVENLTAGTGNLVELNVVGSIESAPISMEACNSYEWNGQTYTTSNTYTYTTASASGCDSIATLNLTILPNYTITFNANGGNGTMAPQTACSGETVTLNANTFTNSGSNFMGWATSASGNVVYANGAEVTLTGNINLYAVWNTACTNANATVTVANCDSYTWYGTEYTTSGTYTHTVQNAVEGGCDSIYTLNLTINHSNNSQTTQTACDSYTWHGQTYTASGTYTYNGLTAEGCTDVQTLNLTIEQSGTSTVSETACDSYTWSVNSQTYTTSGTYTYSGTTAAGCVVSQTLNLTINQSNNSTVSETACDSYTWNGQTYTTSGTYTHTGTTAAGCADVQTLNLTINQSNNSTVSETACDSYTWNGQTYTTSGTYTHNGTTAAGCADVQTLNLTINQSNTSNIYETACDSYTWSVNGQTYTAGGTYSYSGTTPAGCPDVQTLNLTINQSTNSTETQQVCDSYTWYGQTYTASGTYTHSMTGANGCNNTVTLHLTVGHSTSSTDVIETCDSYTWRNGNTYTSSTNIPTWTTTNSEGCTETVTLHLTIHYSFTTRLNEQVPAGEAYSGNGFYVPAYDEPGLYHDTMTLQTIYGCDSTVILNLVVLEPTGIDDIDNVSMRVYPNPTAGKVNIALDGVSEVCVEMYDIYGRRIERQEEVNNVATIDMSSYTSGVYFVRIYKADKLIATTKVVRK